jgi:PIN domain nuclease of toxin-antitoxin system
LRHTAKVEKLPFHHRDPFDRLLIAQAMTEKLTIVSADSVFSDYGVKILW